LGDWLCPELSDGEFWDVSKHWEQDHSNEWNLWMGDSEPVRERNRRANKLSATDPSKAFQIRKELADNGSVWAMCRTGSHYEYGKGIDADLALAEHYYYQAQMAGSWMATLQLSDLLFKHRINERWVGILENGVESDFIPANFWLAWYRYKRRPRRQTAREARPLMEEAAEAGHPGARLILAEWKGQGKYGLHEMRQGFREFSSVLRDFNAGKLRDYKHDVEGASA
jgi:TPR repeat protein